MPFAKGKDVLYASILSRIQVQTGMIFTGTNVNVARDNKSACRIPRMLLRLQLSNLFE
jgi:hypothetical protein